MRAILLTHPKRVEVVDDWPEPEPAPDDVVVAMRSVGLCGSDLGVYDGQRTTPDLPWVMGHEGGGEIVAVGSAVTDRHVGQRVAIEPNYCCFRCPACRAGRTSACPDRAIVGINVGGLLAERVAVPARFTWPVPDSVPDVALACVEPVAVAQAAVRRSGIGPASECLVVGAGSQGLFTCQALLAAGVQPFVTEPNAERLALAERLGAKPIEPAEQRRFPFVFDTVGVPAAWDTSLRAAEPGGSVVVIGMSSQPVQLSTMDLTRRQLTLAGSLIYDHPHDFAATVTSIVDQQLVPEQVLCEATPAARADEAFKAAATSPGKTWLDLTTWREVPHA
ncbi:MAG: alcohol dehydrogenase catalytic domain-containing protein [Actinophytocola sp.]|nr:alcohol dehydrogenase catalytic domain-containing protein [Actinophytocola sp.]